VYGYAYEERMTLRVHQNIRAFAVIRPHHSTMSCGLLLPTEYQ